MLPADSPVRRAPGAGSGVRSRLRKATPATQGPHQAASPHKSMRGEEMTVVAHPPPERLKQNRWSRLCGSRIESRGPARENQFLRRAAEEMVARSTLGQ